MIKRDFGGKEHTRKTNASMTVQWWSQDYDQEISHAWNNLDSSINKEKKLKRGAWGWQMKERKSNALRISAQWQSPE